MTRKKKKKQTTNAQKTNARSTQKRSPALKRKRTAAEKKERRRAKAERQAKYAWVLLNGKQVRVRRAPSVEGVFLEEYLAQNADLLWLHAHGEWASMECSTELSRGRGFSEEWK